MDCPPCLSPTPSDQQRQQTPHNMWVMKCNDSAHIKTGKGDVRKVVTGERWWVDVLPRPGSPDWRKTPPSSIPPETCGPDSSCRSLLAENWASCIHVNVVMSAPFDWRIYKLFISIGWSHTYANKDITHTKYEHSASADRYSRMRAPGHLQLHCCPHAGITQYHMWETA